MRISRPVLHEQSPIYREDGSDENDDDEHYSGLSDALLIPNSVGDFYLGEPANFMVTVQNVSSHPMAKVRVLIQTESRNVPRVNVHESERSGELAPNELETLYFKIDCRHPEEIAMLCNVTYEWQGEQSFKRKYLLPVKTPFELAWDYSILGAGSNLLKITVTNKIEKQIIFEECALNSQVLNINTVYESPKTMLGFNDTYTKTLLVATVDTGEFQNVQMSLDLKWKSEAGNRGHIQYSQIRPRANPKAEIDVRVKPKGEDGPLTRFEVTDVEVIVRNNTERNVDLVIDLCDGESVHWSGTTHQTLGLLPPQNEKSLELQIIPLIRGTHHLPGLAFTDTLLGLTYQFKQLFYLQVE